MISAATRSSVGLPAVSDSEISAGVFTNKPLPEPEWEAPIIAPADAEPIREISWLWPGRIPFGKVSLLTGPSGCGKSLLALDLAARVSRGERLPRSEQDQLPDWHDGFRGGVLVVSPLHEADDFVRPRLRDMGADLSQVHVFSSVAG